MELQNWYTRTMEDEKNLKKYLKIMQGSIFESYSAYTVWKAIFHSRSTEIVDPKLAERYVDAQKVAPAFFVMTERMALASFVIFVLHVFDRDQRTCNFFKLDGKKTEEFIKNNKSVLDKLKVARDEVFAHKNFQTNNGTKNIQIPPITELDPFFENLFKLYNTITAEKVNSSTAFHNGPDSLLHEMEFMYLNLARGKQIHTMNVDQEYMWTLNPKKMSSVFSSENRKSKNDEVK